MVVISFGEVQVMSLLNCYIEFLDKVSTNIMIQVVKFIYKLCLNKILNNWYLIQDYLKNILCIV